jgi:uncharacterized protein (TIGR02246 family)
MSEQRPKLDLKLDPKPVDAFVRGLQEAIDTGNADLFNLQFADDVLWGSPFGAVAVGYEQIHGIHSQMFSLVKPSPGASRYKVEHVRFPSNNVAIAYVRRLAAQPRDHSDKQSVGGFDELAIFVLVERDGEWWLAAAQHVPDRRDVYLQR